MNLERSTAAVKALRVVRKMRGKSGACLIECDNGFSYVVKLANNPQGGRRSLVNEWIGSTLLTQLGIATPEVAFIQIDDQCIGNNGSLQPGVHFGSRYPGASQTTVWDLFPARLLPKVSNYHHFAGALMVDQWTANADTRQAVFFRQAANGTEPGLLVAQMIDNGSMFGGHDWVLPESAAACTHDPIAAHRFDFAMCDFEPWLSALEKLSPEVVDAAVAKLPENWLSPGDEPLLRNLLAQLWKRQEQVPAIMEWSVNVWQAARQRSMRHSEEPLLNTPLTSESMDDNRMGAHDRWRGIFSPRLLAACAVA